MQGADQPTGRAPPLTGAVGRDAVINGQAVGDNHEGASTHGAAGSARAVAKDSHQFLLTPRYATITTSRATGAPTVHFSQI
ncbi:hypothetical protein Air01nite_12130 [Asanoa iriomotensis]|uniref:Uncharacterized protein n=1 Tax=Asanoa iriomotensis TaxID=234613 RepID=A0ABQ4BX61_9ACTN|nr:hypothetical protein Air01nite_12130 [Asanoa iriomotensis]